jgi:DNA-binding HxlR family transcriptional regulator
MTERNVNTRRTYGQPCPVASALDVVGERWTLLIVRDLMFGALRFSDLRDGLTGLAPNLLSERLKMLVSTGIVEQVELPPPAARTVYALTARGRELGPVVHGLARFGLDDWTDPDVWPPPERLVRGALLALMEPDRLGAQGWTLRIVLPDAEVGVTVGPRSSGRVGLDRLRLEHARLADRSTDATMTTSLGTLLGLRRSTIDRSTAVADGRLELAGSTRALDQLARLFVWPSTR